MLLYFSASRALVLRRYFIYVRVDGWIDHGGVAV